MSSTDINSAWASEKLPMEHTWGEVRLIREAGREMVLSGKTLQNSYVLYMLWASLVAQTVKNLPAMWETQVRSLGWEDPLEKRMATYSSILAWRIPWAELQSMGSQRVT